MKPTPGGNLTGHPYIIFLAVTFLHNHPELPIQARMNSLSDIYSELHGLYGEGQYKDRLKEIGDSIEDLQKVMINKIDGDEYQSVYINKQRAELFKIQKKIKGLIVEMGILREASYGTPSQEEI